MRYYSIVLTNPTSGELIAPKSLAALNTGASYTSTSNGLASGTPLLGALSLSLDIPVAPFAAPAGQAWVQLKGPSLQEISQANNLNGANVSIYGGFTKGLPLENPTQAGLLVSGSVYAAFGNWIGTEQTLDLLVYPPLGTNAAPANITFNWPKGTLLAQALQQTLSVAYPTFAAASISISDNLVLTEDQAGVYQTLSQFSQYIKTMSAALLGGTYLGVDISLNGTQLTVFDGTVQTSPKAILFQELIGQPTWLDPSTIQFQCPMRSDVKLSDYVTMPKALVTSSAGSVSPLVNANSTFKGTFYVGEVRHVGDSRAAGADSWLTVFNAYTTPVPIAQ